MNISKDDALKRHVERRYSLLVSGLPEPRGERIAALMRRLLSCPYVDNPLRGGPGQVELLEIGLDAFDCVTFVETVLALARSVDFESHVRELLALRYLQAEPTWEQRLHYFSDWLVANTQRRVLRNRSYGRGSIRLRKVLSCVPGLPRKENSFWVVPAHELFAAAPRIEQGSVLAFASTRAELDFFHVGLASWDVAQSGEQRLMLCHASRSQGNVVAEPLMQFVKRNSLDGVSIAVPR